MRIIVHDEETRVYDALTNDRNIVEHVLCLLEACGSIDVSAELGTDALKPVEKSLSREILCTVEAHMLEEVCKTILVILFLVCTYVSSEIELCSLSRLVVMTDVVSHSVLKLSNLYLRIVRKWILTESCKCGEKCRSQ